MLPEKRVLWIRLLAVASARDDSVPAPLPGFRYRPTLVVDGAARKAVRAQALPDDLGDHDLADGAAETFVQPETEMK